MGVMPRKNITSSIETDLIRKLKYLAADIERPLNDLLEEAIRDLLKKHEKKNKK
jgi:predicted transcriptional regulator